MDNPHRYILLDIDGVMIPARGWQAPGMLSDGFPAFKKAACDALQSLIQPGTTIVITSSHKGNYNIPDWKNIFKLRGIMVEELECLPIAAGLVTRKQEVEDWLRSRPDVQHFVIIDDDNSLHGLAPNIKQRFVHTSAFAGLTKENAMAANAILCMTCE